MIDLNEVGARVVSPGKVTFGVYLPEITAAKDYLVVVRVIHELDQFTPEKPARDFPLAFDPLIRWASGPRRSTSRATPAAPATSGPRAATSIAIACSASHLGRPSRRS